MLVMCRSETLDMVWTLAEALCAVRGTAGLLEQAQHSPGAAPRS